MPPPSPGRIHDLPIKILYSLDTSAQSYVTVLPERHAVYVHPRSQQDEMALGSCYLKAAARGICFASPECIPNATTLDFSVYSLDPSRKPASTRAFPHPAQIGTDDSWTGKGFLSWVLGEAATGKTLVKGKLVREHEFSALAFNDQGGLEGLMAAASRAENGSTEDRDGKGWGLEVGISLKMVNPDGKDEFKGRREFEDMMRRGTGLASVSSPVSIATSTPRAQQEPIRRNPPSASSSRIAGPPLFQHSSSASSISNRPSPSAQPTRPPSSSSRPSLPSSLPPSSIPMSSSSSAGAGPSIPRAPISTNGHTSFINPATRVQSREVTPPPLPQRKSPPPSTPSREKLAALLRTDEKMSPSMAKHLAQNPVLLKLLKAVPPTALNFSHPQNNAMNGDKESPESNEATTPTPSAPSAPSTSKQKQPIRVFSTEGCCNCGAKESELWRTKTMKDGTKKKVCNACGLYFNKHKRMRPAELWGTNATDDAGSSHMHQEKRIKLDEQPIRHSPRLHRGPSEHPPQVPSIAESPRRRRVTKPIPHPSPRMATRASSRQEHGMEPKALDFSDSLFSPSTMFGTSPANPASVPGSAAPHPNHALGVDNSMGGLGMGGEDIDIEALLNQMVAADGQNGFSLDELFASASTENGDNLLDLLSSWDEGKDGLVSTGL